MPFVRVISMAKKKSGKKSSKKTGTTGKKAKK